MPQNRLGIWSFQTNLIVSSLNLQAHGHRNQRHWTKSLCRNHCCNTNVATFYFFLTNRQGKTMICFHDNRLQNRLSNCGSSRMKIQSIDQTLTRIETICRVYESCWRITQFNKNEANHYLFPKKEEVLTIPGTNDLFWKHLMHKLSKHIILPDLMEYHSNSDSSWHVQLLRYCVIWQMIKAKGRNAYALVINNHNSSL